MREHRSVRELDQAGTGDKIWIVEVKNTAAPEMAQKLGEIFQVAQLGTGKGRAPGAPATPGQPGKQPPRAGDLTSEMMVSKIIPDERSNQLIVIATDRAYARVLMLVKKLDVPIEGGDGRIHVYYCENANCDELAQTIGAVTGIGEAGAIRGEDGLEGGSRGDPGLAENGGVRDQHGRLARQGHRDHDALEHPAGKLVGIVAHHRLRVFDLDALEQRDRPTERLGLADVSVRRDRLGDLKSDGEDRIE